MFDKVELAIKQEETQIEEILPELTFKNVKKKMIRYVRFTGSDYRKMPPLSFWKSTKSINLITTTSDGVETRNTVEVGDYILSGPSKEKYSIKANKLEKLYIRIEDDVIVPEQTSRSVARYTGSKTIWFKAPWGELTVLKTGDYVVKDGSSGYYRIAKKEFENTYNKY